MLSRTEFVVNRHGMLGPRIAALLRSTVIRDPHSQEGPGNEPFCGDPAMVSGLERTAQHADSRNRRPAVLSRLIFPARPNS